MPEDRPDSDDGPTSPPRRAWLRRSAGLAAWGALPLGLGACGGGGSDGGMAGGGTGFDAAARSAALRNAQAEFDRLRAGRLRADPGQLAQALRATGHFSRVVQMDDGGVGARFPDGHWLLVGNPPDPAAGSDTARSGDPRPAALAQPLNAAATAAAAPAATRAFGVPASRQARSFCEFSNYVREDGEVARFDTYEQALRDAGWEVPADQFAEVETLRALPELGLLNWSTHGGTLNADGDITHALFTGTPADEHTLARHQADLDAGRLIYYTAATVWGRGAWHAQTNFAITPAFIAHHGWRFSADSVVMIHACASDHPAWRAAFANAGAALYGGWSRPAWVHRVAAASDRLLDDLLATNRRTPEGQPLERAHHWVAVLARSDADGVTQYDDPSEGGGNTRFRFHVLRGQPGGLMPTLQRLLVSEAEGTLTLRGGFGSMPGEVWIGPALSAPASSQESLPWQPRDGALALGVQRWSDEEIVVRLPRSGPGSAGHVAVRVGQRWSNARPLTRWSTTLELQQRGPGSLTLEHRLAISLRADIQAWRDAPRGALQVARLQVLGTPPEAPSHWTWRASGSHTHSHSPDSLQTVHWAGSGRIALAALPVAGATEAFNLVGAWNPAAESPRFELAMVGARHEAVTATELIQEGGNQWTTTHLQSLELPDRLAEDAGQLGLRWAPDAGHALPEAVTRFEHATGLLVAGPDAAPLASTLRMPRATAEHAPDADGLGGL